MQSIRRACRRSTWPTCARTSSPTWCPNRSLTSLKRSRSPLIRLTSVLEALGARELDLELPREPASVQQVGQRIRVGGLGQARDERGHALAGDHEQRRRDRERAHGDDPCLHHPGSRRLEGERDRVPGRHDHELQRDPRAIEEVGRAEDHPEVVEGAGRRRRPREVDRGADQQRPERRCDVVAPVGQPVTGEVDQRAGQVRAGCDGGDAEVVRVRGVRKREPDQADGRAGDEQRDEKRRQRPPLAGGRGGPARVSPGWRSSRTPVPPSTDADGALRPGPSARRRVAVGAARRARSPRRRPCSSRAPSDALGP